MQTEKAETPLKSEKAETPLKSELAMWRFVRFLCVRMYSSSHNTYTQDPAPDHGDGVNNNVIENNVTENDGTENNVTENNVTENNVNENDGNENDGGAYGENGVGDINGDINGDNENNGAYDDDDSESDNGAYDDPYGDNGSYIFIDDDSESDNGNGPAVGVQTWVVPSYGQFQEIFGERGVDEARIHCCIAAAMLILCSSYLFHMKETETGSFLCARYLYLCCMTRLFSDNETPKNTIIRFLSVDEAGPSIMNKLYQDAEIMVNELWSVIPVKTQREKTDTNLAAKGYLTVSTFFLGYFFK